MTSFFPEKNDQNNQRMTSLLRSEMSPPLGGSTKGTNMQKADKLFYTTCKLIMSQFGHLVKQKTRKHV